MAIARAKNRQGEPGKPGEPGKDAVQPKFSVGEVSIGDEARVWLTGSILKPVLNFVLPRGKKGDKGDAGKSEKTTVTKVVHMGGDVFSAGGGSAEQTAITETILAGQTKVVHSVALADFFTIEYLFNVRKNDLTKSRGFRLLVNRTDTGLDDTIFARLGGGFAYSISANVNGLNAEIVITNNEAFDILSTFKFTKLI